MSRFWVQWQSRHEQVETPFTKWKLEATRYRGAEYRYSYGAVIDAIDRESAWQEVASRYSDASEVFVRERDNDFWPSTAAARPQLALVS